MMVNDLLMDLDGLAAVLCRSPRTVRDQLYTRPELLPPPLQMPGTRKVVWRRVDVARWLEDLPTRWEDGEGRKKELIEIGKRKPGRPRKLERGV